MSGAGTLVRRVGRRNVEVSHPDKVLFPDDGITKAELVDYYVAASTRMLPHLRGRPVNLQRFPDGIAAGGFFQQARPGYFPEWIDGVEVAKEGGELCHVLIDEAAALAYIANQNCITPHAWLSRTGALDHPDQLIIDVDPPDARVAGARESAVQLGDLFRELELTPFVKTTGSRGFHVLVPLDGTLDFDTVRAFARDAATVAARRRPDALTVEPRKAKREGRIYLDTLRNAYAHTAVPPYAVRARPGAPVAAPISWDELDDPDMHSERFTLRTITRRLEDAADPWRDLRRRARALGPARKRLDALLAEPAPSRIPRTAPPDERGGTTGSKRSVAARSSSRNRSGRKPR